MKSLRNPLLILVSIAAMPANGIEPPAGTPTEAHDWECAYAYSDTTCEAMMAAWSEDVDLEGDIVALKPCTDCQPVYEKGYEGTEYQTGYRCKSREGHELKTENTEAKISIYLNGGVDGGWRVTDWKFQNCLFVFECSAECAATTEGPQCFITSGYYIGRWMPTLGESCAIANPSQGDASEESGHDEAGDSSSSHYTNESSYK